MARLGKGWEGESAWFLWGQKRGWLSWSGVREEEQGQCAQAPAGSPRVFLGAQVLSCPGRPWSLNRNAAFLGGVWCWLLASFIPQWAVYSAHHSGQGAGRTRPVGSSFSRAQKERGVSRLGLGVGISMRSHPQERCRHTTTLGNATKKCCKYPPGCWATRGGRLPRRPPGRGGQSSLVLKRPLPGCEDTFHHVTINNRE